MNVMSNNLPLNRMCYQDSTFILEMLIPYLPPQAKLPLAIYIKYAEFTRMLQIFSNPKSLDYYGMNVNEFSMDSLFNAFACCPNPNISSQLEQAKQMMKMLQMAEAMNSMQDLGDLFTTEHDNTCDWENPDNDESAGPTYSSHHDGASFDEIIEQILKEGDYS